MERFPTRVPVSQRSQWFTGREQDVSERLSVLTGGRGGGRTRVIIDGCAGWPAFWTPRVDRVYRLPEPVNRNRTGSAGHLFAEHRRRRVSFSGEGCFRRRDTSPGRRRKRAAWKSTIVSGPNRPTASVFVAPGARVVNHFNPTKRGPWRAVGRNRRTGTTDGDGAQWASANRGENTAVGTRERANAVERG